MKVKIKTSKLKDRMLANRQKHLADYERMVAVFKAKLIDWANNLIRDTKLITPQQRITLRTDPDFSVPTNYLKEYDTAIDMLTNSIDEEIELSTEEYNKYWNDNWTWKQNFDLSKISYGLQDEYDNQHLFPPRFGYFFGYTDCRKFVTSDSITEYYA